MRFREFSDVTVGIAKAERAEGEANHYRLRINADGGTQSVNLDERDYDKMEALLEKYATYEDDRRVW